MSNSTNTTDQIHKYIYMDAEEVKERNKILNFLKENTGKFFTAREIARECGFPTRGTQVEVRKCITLLLEIDSQPIIGMAKGFGYVTNAYQMTFYANQLKIRMEGLQKRIDTVKRIATEMGNKNE